MSILIRRFIFSLALLSFFGCTVFSYSEVLPVESRYLFDKKMRLQLKNGASINVYKCINTIFTRRFKHLYSALCLEKKQTIFVKAFEYSKRSNQDCGLYLIFKESNGLLVYSVSKKEGPAWFNGDVCGRISSAGEITLGQGSEGCGTCIVLGGYGTMDVFRKIMKQALSYGDWGETLLPDHEQRETLP